jgi:hypothetical protein
MSGVLFQTLVRTQGSITGDANLAPRGWSIGESVPRIHYPFWLIFTRLSLFGISVSRGNPPLPK